MIIRLLLVFGYIKLCIIAIAIFILAYSIVKSGKKSH